MKKQAQILRTDDDLALECAVRSGLSLMGHSRVGPTLIYRMGLRTLAACDQLRQLAREYNAKEPSNMNEAVAHGIALAEHHIRCSINLERTQVSKGEK